MRPSREVDEHELALAIARNALGLQLPVAEVVASSGVDPRAVLLLGKNKAFTDMVARYKRELSEDGEGIRLKSSVALEGSISKLYTLVHNVDTPANVVVQGIKQLADMAQVGGKDKGTAAAPGSGFSVHIDLSGLKDLSPADKAAIVIDASPTEAVDG